MSIDIDINFKCDHCTRDKTEQEIFIICDECSIKYENTSHNAALDYVQEKIEILIEKGCNTESLDYFGYHTALMNLKIMIKDLYR